MNFMRANINRIVAIAPRNEPLETPIEDPVKTKHETHYGILIMMYNKRKRS